MSITSIRPRKKSVNFKKLFIWAIIFGSLFGLLSYYQERIPEILGIQKKATISISTLETDVKVYINSNLVGEAPIENLEINPGLVNLSIRGLVSGFSTNLNIIDDSENIIYRELGVNKDLSSGVNIWEGTYDEKKVEVFVNPSNAKVFVNEKELNSEEINKLVSGNYKFKVIAEGYKDLAFSVNIRDGFKTNIDVKLPPLPSEEEIVKFKDYQNLYVIKSSNPDVFSYTPDWLEYLNYYQKRRGLVISELGIVKDDFFEYFIDSDGRVFDKNLNQIDDFDSIEDLDSKKTALLHKNISKEILNNKNKDTISALYSSSLTTLVKNEKIEQRQLSAPSSQVLGTENSATKFVLIKAEWLRVRKSPGGEEIAKVNEGDKLELVSESDPEWYQIKTKDGKQGFISKQFAEKQN